MCAGICPNQAWKLVRRMPHPTRNAAGSTRLSAVLRRVHLNIRKQRRISAGRWQGNRSTNSRAISRFLTAKNAKGAKC